MYMIAETRIFLFSLILAYGIVPTMNRPVRNYFSTLRKHATLCFSLLVLYDSPSLL